MAEFDDKLNSLLSNPEAMDQIMKMAQSLMGTSGDCRRGIRLRRAAPGTALRQLRFSPAGRGVRGGNPAGSRRGRLEPAIRRPVRAGSQLSFRAGKS